MARSFGLHSRSLRVALLGGLVAFGAPRAAFAGDAAAAEQLFDQGAAAMKANNFRAACDAFAASNEADPASGTQINLGDCNEKQKKYATALTWYQAAARFATEKGQADRVKLANAEAARVEAKVHKIVVSAKVPVDGMKVTRDGIPTVLGTETPVDPGKHAIEVSAKGKKPWTTTLDIPEAAGKTPVEIPQLADAPPEEKAAGGGGAPGGDYAAPAGAQNDGSGQRTVGIIVGGAGVLGLLAAGGVFILAKNVEGQAEKNEEEKRNAGGTDAEIKAAGASRREAAQNNELIAQITGAGGIVLLGVGAVLYFTAPKSKATGKTHVLPAVGPGYAGLGLGGTF